MAARSTACWKRGLNSALARFLPFLTITCDGMSRQQTTIFSIVQAADRQMTRSAAPEPGRSPRANAVSEGSSAP